MPKALLLVVDDSTETLQMYTTKLLASGFSVDAAHNGAEALEKMKSDKPDLVMMDMLMPELSGLEALRKAKADPDIKHIPIVMLTNQSEDDDIKAAMEAGASSYILKVDLTPNQVVEKVKALLSPSSEAAEQPEDK